MSLGVNVQILGYHERQSLCLEHLAMPWQVFVSHYELRTGGIRECTGTGIWGERSSSLREKRTLLVRSHFRELMIKYSGRSSKTPRFSNNEKVIKAGCLMYSSFENRSCFRRTPKLYSYFGSRNFSGFGRCWMFCAFVMVCPEKNILKQLALSEKEDDRYKELWFWILLRKAFLRSFHHDYRGKNIYFEALLALSDNLPPSCLV